MAFENIILNANVKCHGKCYWKMHWKIPLEKFIWKCQGKTPLENAIFRCHFRMPFSNAIFQCRFAMKLSNVIFLCRGKFPIRHRIEIVGCIFEWRPAVAFSCPLLASPFYNRDVLYMPFVYAILKLHLGMTLPNVFFNTLLEMPFHLRSRRPLQITFWVTFAMWFSAGVSSFNLQGAFLIIKYLAYSDVLCEECCFFRCGKERRARSKGRQWRCRKQGATHGGKCNGLATSAEGQGQASGKVNLEVRSNGQGRGRFRGRCKWQGARWAGHFQGQGVPGAGIGKGECARASEK